MAGIGQRFTSDSLAWNSSHSSFPMGRTYTETSKPFNNFMAPDKRAFVTGGSSTTSSAFSDPFNSSLRSSMRNGEIGRQNATYMPEQSSSSNLSNLENGQSGLSAIGAKRSMDYFNSAMSNTSSSALKQMSSMLNSSSRLPQQLQSNGNGTLLDPSDFPPIQSMSSISNSSKVVGGHTSQHLPEAQMRNYLYALSSTASSNSVQQLQQQQQLKSGVDGISAVSTTTTNFESDFPALPGTQATSTGSRSQPHTPQPNSLMMNGPQSQQHHPLTPAGMSTPKNMISDQFGMTGLLKLMKVGELDNAHYLLAPGQDLMQFNINCLSPGARDLYPTLMSPCHDSSMGRPQDIDYPVPQEYLIRHLISDQLIDPFMDKLHISTLFWLFYNCCQEEVQLVAAKELYNRHWRFHKQEQLWITRALQKNIVADQHNETGTYVVWDPLTGKQQTRDMVIYYTDLDEAPLHYRTTSGLLSASIVPTTNPSTGNSQGSSTTPAVQLQGGGGGQQSSYNMLMSKAAGMKQNAQRPSGLVTNGQSSIHVSASSPSLLSNQHQHLLGTPNAVTNGPSVDPLSMLTNSLQDKLHFKDAAGGSAPGSKSAGVV